MHHYSHVYGSRANCGGVSEGSNNVSGAIAKPVRQFWFQVLGLSLSICPAKALSDSRL